MPFTFILEWIFLLFFFFLSLQIRQFHVRMNLRILVPASPLSSYCFSSLFIILCSLLVFIFINSGSLTLSIRKIVIALTAVAIFLTHFSLKSTIFWDTCITPCSPLKVSEGPAFTRVSCSAFSSTLKMEAICSSETSVDFQRTTRRYTPEDSTLYNNRCENLKSYAFKFVFTWACIYVQLGQVYRFRSFTPHRYLRLFLFVQILTCIFL
jgi:hypothetical protein